MGTAPVLPLLRGGGGESGRGRRTRNGWVVGWLAQRAGDRESRGAQHGASPEHSNLAGLGPAEPGYTPGKSSKESVDCGRQG